MANATAQQTKWAIDPMHSEVQFKVKHLVISTVTGSFGKFEGEALSEGDDFSNAKISFTAYTDSIDTGNEQRDSHLKSDDFFNVAQYPTLKFVSKEVSKAGDDKYKLVGDLTIRDVTKTVSLDVEHGGIAADAYGNTKAGFEVTGSINRKEYGLKWNGVTEAGNVVVSDNIKIVASIQLAKQ